MTKALNVTIAATKTVIVIQLNLAPVYIDTNDFSVMDFTGISITGPVRYLNIAGTAHGVVAAVVAATANQALVTQ